MKKTISIQISGLPFIIDEDAYARLDQYLAGIRMHFAGMEDAEEIVQDIESRIAEQFTDRLKKSKKVINLQDVEELIASMGTVADIAQYEDEPVHGMKTGDSQSEDATGKSQEWSAPFFSSTRRLYRDPDDQVIAGVASGIAQYFGIDPVIVRILFVVFTFANGLGLLAYIVLWIAVPEAKTLSDRVDMKGEPVTLSNLQEEIAEGTRRVDVPAFHAVRAGGAVRMRIRQGPHQSVVLRGPRKDVEHARVRVEQDELVIEREHGSWMFNLFRGYGPLTVDIETPHLSSLHISGASTAEVQGVRGDSLTLRVSGACKAQVEAQVHQLSAHVSGASTLTLRGSGDALELELYGASRADTSSFRVKTAQVDVSGASFGSVAASDTIGGSVHGASKLGYQGSPTLHVEHDMSSSVKARWVVHTAQHTRGGQMRETANRARARIESQLPGGVATGAVKTGSALGRFIVGIVHFLFGIIGAVIALGAAVGLFLLVCSTLYLLVTGGAPHFDVSPLELLGFPLFYVLLAASFVLAFVPLVFLAQLGGSIASLRNNFSVAGTITLAAFWIAALVTVIVTATAAGPSLRSRFQQLRVAHLGEQIDRTFPVQDFTSIQAGGALRLHVVPGKQFSVVAHGNAREIQALTATVSGGQLTLDPADTHHAFFCILCRDNDTTVSVTLPSLTGMHLTGASHADVTGVGPRADAVSFNLSGASRAEAAVQANSVMAHVAGASRLVLRGSGTELQVTANGASHVLAQQFSVVRSTVDSDGASRVELNARQQLRGELSGASRLLYVPYPGLTPDVRTRGASRIDTLDDGRADANENQDSDLGDLSAPDAPERPLP